MTNTIRSLGTASEDAGIPHSASASVIPQAVSVREPWYRRGVPAWLQAAPMALVFAVFLVIPLLLVVMVSFWDYNDFEILPGFTFRSYVETFEGCYVQLPELCTILKTYVSTVEFCVIVWAITLVIGFTISYLPGVSHPLAHRADDAGPPVYHSVLDLQRHPHDLVDPAARP